MNQKKSSRLIRRRAVGYLRASMSARSNAITALSLSTGLQQYIVVVIIIIITIRVAGVTQGSGGVT
jgi:hypothetical protein